MRKQTMKHVAWALTLGLAAMPLAACSGQGTSGDQSAEVPEDATDQGTAEVDISSLKTLGDVMAIESETSAAAWNEQRYIYVVDVNGAPLRAVAELTPELYSQIEALDFLDEHHDEKLKEIIGGLELASLDDYSDRLPSQEEMDALVGKTVQELLDDGYIFFGLTYYGGEETVGQFDKDDFRYEITLDGTVPEDVDTYDETAIADLPVASVSFSELSEAATNPENLG